MALRKSATEYRTFQPREGVVETILPGRLTAETLQFAFAELEGLGTGPIWFIDCSATESFESACIRLTASVLPQLKERGLKRIVAVLPSASLRMAAGAVRFATSIDFRVVESRLEALPLLIMKK